MSAAKEIDAISMPAHPHAPNSIVMPFGDRMIRARHADESAFTVFGCPNCGPDHSFVVAGFAIDTTSPPTRALFVSMSATQAREIAAMLMELADELDGGKGKQ